jgi:hypothetical protein
MKFEPPKRDEKKELGHEPDKSFELRVEDDSVQLAHATAYMTGWDLYSVVFRDFGAGRLFEAVLKRGDLVSINWWIFDAVYQAAFEASDAYWDVGVGCREMEICSDWCHRYRMLGLAVAKDPDYEASRAWIIDLMQNAPACAVNIVRKQLEQLPNIRLPFQHPETMLCVLQRKADRDQAYLEELFQHGHIETEDYEIRLGQVFFFLQRDTDALLRQIEANKLGPLAELNLDGAKAADNMN